MYAGEHSRLLHPLRGVACSTAEPRRGMKPSGRSRTSDLAIIDAADLFATGEQDWRGTYDAVHALAGRALRIAGFEPVRRRGAFPRSNSHLHHRRVRASRADVEVAGEQSIFGGTPTDTRSAACEALAARDAPACQADSTARSIGGGVEPALPWERSIQNLHHQRISPHARETSHDWY
jgi:hypothetical protein